MLSQHGIEFRNQLIEAGLQARKHRIVKRNQPTHSDLLRAAMRSFTSIDFRQFSVARLCARHLGSNSASGINTAAVLVLLKIRTGSGGGAGVGCAAMGSEVCGLWVNGRGAMRGFEATGAPVGLGVIGAASLALNADK
jgi:hypothetical protein